MQVGDLVKHDQVVQGRLYGVVIAKPCPQAHQKPFIYVLTAGEMKRWCSIDCEVISEAS